eukprot:289113-Hanusia_phi.AAC.1
MMIRPLSESPSRSSSTQPGSLAPGIPESDPSDGEARRAWSGVLSVTGLPLRDKFPKLVTRDAA